MHSFAHNHRETGASSTEGTRGLIMNWGWRYDLMVGFLDTFIFSGKLQKLQQKAIDLAQLQPGEAVLDVGCGTGTLALRAYQYVGKTPEGDTAGRVCGIDPGLKQIARARSKAERAGLPIDFQVGVIERLAFPDQSFDIVLSTLMMHHLPEDLKQRGLSEIARVLKPGGRLLVVDFERPQKQQRKFGAGETGIQDLPELMKEEPSFSHIESGEIRFPRFPRAGFARAHKG